ncbi:MAG: endonuclease III [Patescibacteria group bacterium]
MKKERTNLPEITRILTKLFPDPKCALHYKKAWELLVAVILSAQCTDKKVNEVTKELFKKYPTLDDYVRADPKEFEQAIYSTGFYKAKTKNILAAAKAVQENFKGKIPKTMGEMITVPGVGRKTANVVLGELYGFAEGIAVDTHVIRLSRLLGLTKHSDAVKIERDLMKIVPEKDWVRFSHLLILYGRGYCQAHCKHLDCPLANFIKA